jgi:hypothetical protein
MRFASADEDRCKSRPGVGRGHIHDADSFEPRLGWLDPKQLRLLLAVLDAAPELALGGDDQVLIERIGMSDDLDLLP